MLRHFGMATRGKARIFVHSISKQQYKKKIKKPCNRWYSSTFGQRWKYMLVHYVSSTNQNKYLRERRHVPRFVVKARFVALSTGSCSQSLNIVVSGNSIDQSITSWIATSQYFSKFDSFVWLWERNIGKRNRRKYFPSLRPNLGIEP